jgi:SAM-dependent methyltransferase
LRHWYYAGGGNSKLPDKLKLGLGDLMGLEDDGAIGTRRLEIGPGPYPTSGYLHMDLYPWGPHLEAIGPMWEIPFPDDWATEIKAIQCLEHVHPSRLEDTLREWHRVLRPSGSVLVSVPNGPAIMDVFKRVPVAEKWPLGGSLLGMYCGPDLRDPRQLKLRSDHQIIFDWTLLESALQAAGFDDIVNISDQWVDRHSEAWSPLVERYSLVARATA